MEHLPFLTWCTLSPDDLGPTCQHAPGLAGMEQLPFLPQYTPSPDDFLIWYILSPGELTNLPTGSRARWHGAPSSPAGRHPPAACRG